MQIVEEIENRCGSQRSKVNKVSNEGNVRAENEEQLIQKDVISGSDQKQAVEDSSIETYIHEQKQKIDALVRNFRQRRASPPCNSNSLSQFISRTALATIEVGQAIVTSQRDNIGDTANSLHQGAQPTQNVVLTPNGSTAVGQDNNANHPKFAATIESVPVCRKDGHSYKVLQTKKQYQTKDEITFNVVKICSDGALCNCWVDEIEATLHDGVEHPIQLRKRRSQNGGWKLASKLEKAGDFLVKVKVNNKAFDSFPILVASPTTGLIEV